MIGWHRWVVQAAMVGAIVLCGMVVGLALGLVTLAALRVIGLWG